MTLKQYREWAQEVGGEVGARISEIVDQLEEARAYIRQRKIPPLLGSKETAEKIGVDPKNIHHVRKTKLFPEPDLIVGNRPFWFETTIDVYLHLQEERRETKGK